MDEQEAKKAEKKDHPTLEEQKAQGKESEDRSTEFGTRAAGSQHG